MARMLDQDQAARRSEEARAAHAVGGQETSRRPSREQIAEAAYYRWRRDGGEAEANWIAAEQELQREPRPGEAAG